VFKGIDDLDCIRNAHSGRASSWDRSGGNFDFITIPAGQSAVLADLAGPGRITHIWFAQEKHYRDCLIRITWDDAPYPSVLCPLGDFFCLGHTLVNSFESALFSASTRFPHRFQYGCALNCYAPMRFQKLARIEIVNESSEPHEQYFYVDYETGSEPGMAGRGHFHAEFRRWYPFGGWGDRFSNETVARFPNTGRCAWENNYVILETSGKGHYVGCNLSITNFSGGWWGEGDDMIWIDGYKWPPDLHGTGAEDYFCQAWGMNRAAHLRCGSSIWEGDTSPDSRYSGHKGAYSPRLVGGYQTSYVFHVENPVRFEKDIKVTIEAGHANSQSNEMSSVAYWYAEQPTRVADPPPAAKRRPILRDNAGNWLIDQAAQCPGPPVAENPEFQKAMREYEKRAKEHDWPHL